MALIAGTFGFFQFLMPLLGWICVHWVVDLFQSLLPYIPWISLVLLFTLGLMMIRDGLLGEEEEVCPETSFQCLLLQGLATSMDALSVGFAIASFGARGSCGIIWHHWRGDFYALPFRHCPGQTLRHEAGGQGYCGRGIHPHGHRTGNLPFGVRQRKWGKKGLSVYRWTVFLPSMNHFPLPSWRPWGKTWYDSREGGRQ